jgi:threonine/homoserine/homoserine lactone efflux protein
MSDLLAPFASFAVVSFITPGPNNLLLAASGSAFGFRRTVPHMAGISAGFALLVALCGLGLGAVVAASPSAGLVLRLVGTGYLLWLAWRLLGATAAAVDSHRPCTVLEAALFQFANPKAWMMGITAASAFLPTNMPTWAATLWITVLFSLVGLPCMGLWVLAGSALRRHLARPAVGWTWRCGLALLTLYAAAGLWW